jgi:hypothetical protein
LVTLSEKVSHLSSVLFSSECYITLGYTSLSICCSICPIGAQPSLWAGTYVSCCSPGS